MITCACLAYVENGQILLIRSHHNQVWYFPGGKIDCGETKEEALIRELQEELGLSLVRTDLVYLTHIIADNHDHTDLVELFVYTVRDSLPLIKIGAEISDVAWFDLNDTDLMAPAVVKTLEQIK